MRPDEPPIPSRTRGANGKRRSRSVVVRDCATDKVAIALAEPGVIPAMLGDDLYVEVFAKVKLAYETFTMERFVGGAGPSERATDPYRRLSQIVGWCLSDHSV